MPSLMSKQRLHHHIALSLGIVIYSATLISCGSGESRAKRETTPVVNTPKPKSFEIKTPVELRNIIIKVFDNSDNTLVIQQNFTTTTDLELTLPYILNKDHLYRIEISPTSNSSIYNFLNGQYEDFSLALHALVKVNINNPTQIIYINPASEAIYQRALIRSGYLPTDTEADFTQVTSTQLELATTDVNTATLNAFNQLNLKNLNPSYLLNIFSPPNVTLNSNLYSNTYLSFGYIQQWAKQFPNQPFTGFAQNLAIDLRDGYLDGKKIRGDTTPLNSLITPVSENIDPEKNTLFGIYTRQQQTKNQYAASLKQAVLQLADSYNQSRLNPQGYAVLQQKVYSGNLPTYDSSSNVRVQGAGDYRRAVGFNDTTTNCDGSLFLCKRGITGINLVNSNLPSIDYLVGHYKDANTGCQLDIRANGQLELTQNDKIFRAQLDGDTTDTLLQVDKENFEYLLNSSSAQSTAGNQYQFVQVSIKANQVLSASAGLDRRQAPDQLQTVQAQCNFIN